MIDLHAHKQLILFLIIVAPVIGALAAEPPPPSTNVPKLQENKRYSQQESQHHRKQQNATTSSATLATRPPPLSLSSSSPSPPTQSQTARAQTQPLGQLLFYDRSPAGNNNGGTSQMQLDSGKCQARASCVKKAALNRRSEPLDSMSSNWEKQSCYCDQKCALYDDCCPDSRYAQPVGRRAELGRVWLQAHREAWHCQRINPIFGNVLVKATCHDRWLAAATGGGEEELTAARIVKERCEYAKVRTRGPSKQVTELEQLRQSDPMGSLMPITDLASGITYANSYCLRCNVIPKGEGGASTGAQRQLVEPAKPVYWLPLLECSYDPDHDDRNTLYDLITLKRGQALKYSRERNRWMISVPSNSNSTNEKQSTTNATKNTDINETSSICRIIPTVPDSVEHLIRYCRANTITSCPYSSQQRSASESAKAAELTRAQFECHFGHQSLVYSQTSDSIFYNLGCAKCNYQESVSCGPPVRAREKQLGASATTVRVASLDTATRTTTTTGGGGESTNNGQIMSAPSDHQGGDLLDSIGGPLGFGAAGRSGGLGGQLEGVGAYQLKQQQQPVSFTVLMDFFADTCGQKPDQIYDPFTSMCRDVFCGLNKLFVNGRCIRYEQRKEMQDSAALGQSMNNLTSNNTIDNSHQQSPQQQQQQQNQRLNSTVVALANLFIKTATSILAGSTEEQSYSSATATAITAAEATTETTTTTTTTTSAAALTLITGAGEQVAPLVATQSSSGRSVNQPPRPPAILSPSGGGGGGGELNGTSGDFEIAAGQVLAASGKNSASDHSRQTEGDKSKATTASAKLELAREEDKKVAAAVSSTARIGSQLNSAANSSAATTPLPLESEGAHLQPSNSSSSSSSSGGGSMSPTSGASPPLPLELSGLNLEELPKATAESRMAFAECGKILVQPEHYRLFAISTDANRQRDQTQSQPPKDDETARSATNISGGQAFDHVRRQTLNKGRQQHHHHHLSQDNRATTPTFQEPQIYAFLIPYNLTLASSQFELVRATQQPPVAGGLNSSSQQQKQNTTEQQQQQGQRSGEKQEGEEEGELFKLLVCSPFPTDYPGGSETRFTPAMAYLTRGCLIVSIASLLCYLTLYCLSTFDLRPLAVELAQAGQLRTGAMAHSPLDKSRESRASFEAANKSQGQSLSSRGVACLAASLLAAYLLFIIGHQHQSARRLSQAPPTGGASTQPESAGLGGCAIIAAATYGFFLLAFNWMFLLSYDIWRTLRLATCQLRGPATNSQSRRFSAYTLFALATALIITSLALLVDQVDNNSACLPAVEEITIGGPPPLVGASGYSNCSKFEQDFEQFVATYRPKFGQRAGSCWFANKRALALFFGLPVTLIMLINLLFFLHSSFMVLKTSSRSSRRLNSTTKRPIAAKSYRIFTLASRSKQQAKAAPESAPPNAATGSCSDEAREKGGSADYGQQNSLTTSSLASVQTMRSNLSLSAGSSFSSAAASDEFFTPQESPPQTPRDSNVSMAQQQPEPASPKSMKQTQFNFDSSPGDAGGNKRRLESTQSSSSLATNHSLGGLSIASSLANKYDAHRANLSILMSSIAKDYRLYCRLSTIMGLTWLTGLMASVVNESDALWYLFVVLNTLQGLFIFIAFGCKRSKLVNLEILIDYLRYKANIWRDDKLPPSNGTT